MTDIDRRKFLRGIAFSPVAGAMAVPALAASPAAPAAASVAANVMPNVAIPWSGTTLPAGYEWVKQPVMDFYYETSCGHRTSQCYGATAVADVKEPGLIQRISAEEKSDVED